MAHGILESTAGPRAPLAATTLEQVLAEGRFAVTAEITPPRGSDPEYLRRKANVLRGYVDAVNLTDNPAARVAMSSLASALILKQTGVEPVLQVQTRDRNRLAIQGDLLGASALGINNLLCLGGDPIHIGSDPTAKAVHDLDASQLIALARQLRDEGRDFGGDEVKPRPDFLIAGTCNPFGGSVDIALNLLEAKLDAGADFFQTQAVFDVDRYASFLDAARERGLLPRAKILAGVIPVKSAKMAHHLVEKIPGIVFPEGALARFDESQDAPSLGVSWAVETLQALHKLPGVSGVHVMAIHWEEKVGQILTQAGISPRSLA